MSQEIRTKFIWNEHEYEFDTRDAEDSEKLEKAVDAMREMENKAPKDGKGSDNIRFQCDMIKHFFDICLGDGAGEAICTSKSKIDLCYEPYEAFLKMVGAQKSYITDKGNTFRQYSNRTQRRNPQNPGMNAKGNTHNQSSR